MSAWKIVREDFMFRAVNEETGFRSMRFTSANQAGGVIEKMAGKEAHRDAAERFLAAMR